VTSPELAFATVSDVPPPPGSAPPPFPPPQGSTPPPPPPPDLAPPPGYAAFSNRPTPTRPVRRVGNLSTFVMVLTGVAALATMTTVVLSAGVSQDATDFLQGRASDDEFRDAVGPLNAVQLLAGLATVAAGVLTIVWMFRMANNVRAYGRQTTWSPLFAIFGWFLPPMVLYVIPFLVLRELWKASDPGVPDASDEWRRSPGTWLLWAWFLLFGVLPAVVLAIQVGSFATGGLPSGDLESIAESLEDFGALAVLSGVLNVAAAAVWITFVRRMTRRHTALTNET
jgi:hypothetical protein